MNEKKDGKDTTQCGYAGSDMVGILKKDDCTQLEGDATGSSTSTLETILKEYIQPDFDNGTTHVLQYQNLLTNKMTDSLTNRVGEYNGQPVKGAGSSWKWYTRKLDLMSEMNVYGGIVASSSVYDTGIDNRQYAIFRLKPELMYSYGKERFNYWLKDVASSQWFAFVSHYGYSDTYLASDSHGVRPRFLIGEFFNL